MVVFEVCIDDYNGLATCGGGDVDRVEVCAALELGGLTPSAGLMAASSKQSVPAHVMIRPTSGGFCYGSDLVSQMLGDIAFAKDLGLAGVVVGALTPEFDLDLSVMAQLVKAAGSMEVTLHRAFDLCRDPGAALEQAVDLGVARILTSGGQVRALDGVEMLRELVGRAGDRIEIAAGSGVTAETVAELICETGVRHVHASCSTGVGNAQRLVDMGFCSAEQKHTDADKIRAFRRAIDDLGVSP